jgi:hypothetical protein
VGRPQNRLDAENRGELGDEGRLVDLFTADGSLGAGVVAAAKRDVAFIVKVEFTVSELIEVGPEEKGESGKGDGQGPVLGAPDDRSDGGCRHLPDRGGTAEDAVEKGFRDVDVDRDAHLGTTGVSAFEGQLHPEDGASSFERGLLRKGVQNAEGRGEGEGDRGARGAEGLAVKGGDVGAVGEARVDIARVAGGAARHLEDSGRGEVAEVLDETLGQLEGRRNDAGNPRVVTVGGDGGEVGAGEVFPDAEISVVGGSVPLVLDVRAEEGLELRL